MGLLWEQGDQAQQWAKCQGMGLLWEQDDQTHLTVQQVLISVLGGFAKDTVRICFRESMAF